jgi:hypothetical protein
MFSSLRPGSMVDSIIVKRITLKGAMKPADDPSLNNIPSHVAI